MIEIEEIKIPSKLYVASWDFPYMVRREKVRKGKKLFTAEIRDKNATYFYRLAQKRIHEIISEDKKRILINQSVVAVSPSTVIELKKAFETTPKYLSDYVEGRATKWRMKGNQNKIDFYEGKIAFLRNNELKAKYSIILQW